MTTRRTLRSDHRIAATATDRARRAKIRAQ
jgi:hypothetical protein